MSRVKLTLVAAVVVGSSFATTMAQAENSVSARAQIQFQQRHQKCLAFMKTTPFSCDPACDVMCRASIPFSLKLPTECAPPPDNNACPQTK